MASQVLVYPPYVYQTQSSAFCSVKKLKVEPSGCVFQERTYPQIHVNGRNFGNSHPSTKGSAFQTKIPFTKPRGHSFSLQAGAIVVKDTAGATKVLAAQAQQAGVEAPRAVVWRNRLHFLEGPQRCGLKRKSEELENHSGAMQIVDELSILPAMLQTNMGNPVTVVTATTGSKPAVGTAVEPPVGRESGLSVDEHMANTDSTCQPLRKGQPAPGKLHQPPALGARQQKPAAAFPQQHLNLSQVQHFGTGHQEWNGNFGHRRQQAYIPTSVTSNPFTLSHGSPNHTAVHAHLAGSTHLGGQPTLLPYPSSASLSSAAPVAHLLASPCTSRPMLQHPTYNISHPSGIVHQVPVGINPRLLPSPTIHQTQYKPIFPPHSYIAASPAYTGFPLSPTKLSQYPYM